MSVNFYCETFLLKWQDKWLISLVVNLFIKFMNAKLKILRQTTKKTLRSDTVRDKFISNLQQALPLLSFCKKDRLFATW